MRNTVFTLTLAALVAGCGSSSGKLALSAGIAAPAATTAAAVGALAAGSGIEVSRVRMVVDQIKLEVAGSGGSSGDELVAGPYLIDLSGAALAGGLTQVFDVDAQAGTYQKLKFRIHKLEGGDAQFPAMSGLSIVVDGTIDGAQFSFQSDLDEEQERGGQFQISSGAGDNVTLSIDPSAWFLDEGGARIDPRDTATSRSLRSLIERNIKSSIDAFDDRDRNGAHD